ncbi:conserved hypothetical protein [Mesorhizobium plurifarium]|uniref:Uncharacterized protein n=1 Tax=Mesorhizobium plurifarium TaxID=69974 RepID=A0A090DWE4_MESPL|nr:conserved hypothetical protein [Mesorhizobium plurifarium]
MTEFRLAKVHYVPAELEPGVLYVSDEYKIAMHLCACGCGSKVPVSLGPAGWTVTERNGKPTIRPSIGSGQLPCHSHYFITNGQVEWLRAMSAAQTVAALKFDHSRREAHYRDLNRRSRWWGRLWKRLLGLIGLG